MESTENYTHSILVTKHGIHDIILELVQKFYFDKFLFSKKHLLVFVATYMGIILLNSPTVAYIAEKVSWISHDTITRLLPMISINNANILILFIQAIQSQTASLRYLIIGDVIIRKPYGKSIFLHRMYIIILITNMFEECTL